MGTSYIWAGSCSTKEKKRRVFSRITLSRCFSVIKGSNLPELLDKRSRIVTKAMVFARLLLSDRWSGSSFNVFHAGSITYQLLSFEFATLAFAALNGCMYFCWWNKPFDVRILIPVQLFPEDGDCNPSTEIYEGRYLDFLNHAPIEADKPCEDRLGVQGHHCRRIRVSRRPKTPGQSNRTSRWAISSPALGQ